jgi:transposase
MSAARNDHSSDSKKTLYLAFELGWTKWKLAFCANFAQQPRLREIQARDQAALEKELASAKKRFGLPEDAPVTSCYEAGRDGFWLHRWLTQQGLTNLIVDSASIEVNRRQRRAKSDRLDAAKLLGMLLRHAQLREKVWSVVHVPTPQEEDARQLHRELITLTSQSTEHVNRIKGLLASLGLQITVDKHLPERLKSLRQWDDSPLPPAMHSRLLREFELLQVINRQIRELDRQRGQQVRKQQSPAMDQVRRLLGLKGIGIRSAWLYVAEFFSWRKFRNRREVGSLAGLTPTPYTSGQIRREQGISKAGNRRLRWMAIEIAWCWVQFQPQSELSRWFMRRFGAGNSRQRRIGIVALARKLLVALWRYLETGEVPADAELADWRRKVRVGVIPLDVSGGDLVAAE